MLREKSKINLTALRIVKIKDLRKKNVRIKTFWGYYLELVIA